MLTRFTKFTPTIRSKIFKRSSYKYSTSKLNHGPSNVKTDIMLISGCWFGLMGCISYISLQTNSRISAAIYHP